MSEKGMRELAESKFACSQCAGSRRVITIGGIEADCAACRGFGTWGITIEEIIAFAESIVEQCAQIAETKHVLHGDHYASYYAPSTDGEVIAAAIRSRWQRGEQE